jgi:hypothetical protein
MEVRHYKKRTVERLSAVQVTLENLILLGWVFNGIVDFGTSVLVSEGQVADLGDYIVKVYDPSEIEGAVRDFHWVVQKGSPEQYGWERDS